jgi:hypothetical protein
VVYCQKPFANPAGIIEYLGNYTHRVVISNHRLKAFNDGKITFSYKDYTCSAKQRSITLDADEFVRRFLQHVFPFGFYKIRYFGILALCLMKSKLNQCLHLISKVSYFPVLEGLNAMEVWQTVSGKDLFCCPKCGKGRMIFQPVSVNNVRTG